MKGFHFRFGGETFQPDKEGEGKTRTRKESLSYGVLATILFFGGVPCTTAMPDGFATIVGAAPPSGSAATGYVRIFRKSTPAPRRGIWIWVSGFNPVVLDATAVTELKAKGLPSEMQALRGLGYDVYALDWKDGATRIQDNAFALIDLLAAVRNGTLEPEATPGVPEPALAPGEALAVFGTSMGGLVSRYALLELEDTSVDHEVDLWMTNDSPLNGAYLPIGIQYAANWFTEVGNQTSVDIPEEVSAGDLAAAKQMLIFHHSRAEGTGTPSYSTEYETLFSEITARGDWPSLAGLRKVALASGRGDGVGDPVLPIGASANQILRWIKTNNTSGPTYGYSTASLDAIFPGINAALTFIGCGVNISISPVVRVSFAAEILAARPSGSAEKVFDGTWTDTVLLNGTPVALTQAGVSGYVNGQIPPCIQDNDPILSTFEFPNARTDLKNYITGEILGGVTPVRNAAVAGLPAKTVRNFVQSEEDWAFVQGGTTFRTDSVAETLKTFGTVQRRLNEDCFIPTGSALGYWTPAAANNLPAALSASAGVDTISPTAIPFDAWHVYSDCNRLHTILEPAFVRIIAAEAARAAGLPAIDSLSPEGASAGPGMPDTTIVIQGANFTASDTAILDGQVLATLLIDNTTLATIVPGNMLDRLPGTGTLKVARDGGTGPTSPAVPFSYEGLHFAYLFSPKTPDPLCQGWSGSELTLPGTDRNDNGWLDYGNVGPVGSPGEDRDGNGTAWQIYDRTGEDAYDGPAYFHPLSAAEQTELVATGWTFTVKVRIARNGTGATFDCFTGWGLDIPFGGSSPPHRIGFAVSEESSSRFAVTDTDGTKITLGNGTADDFHTIVARGIPGTTTYDWYLDGVYRGTNDFTTNSTGGLTDGKMNFSAGSTSLVNAASDWTEVSLRTTTSRIHVDATAAAPGTGLNWESAFPDLQNALGAAIPGDEIWVANGTYKPGESSPTSTFQLKSDVEILGGFQGGENSLALRNPDPRFNGAILSGQLDGDNAYHVVTGTGTNATAILDAFTIRDGRADGTSASRNHIGAGLVCDFSGDPTLRNILFLENHASGVGGGMYLNAADPTFENIIVQHNRTTVAGSSVTGEGGGVFLNASDASFTNSAFLGNVAMTDGGAVSLHASDPTFTNVAFVGNRAEILGGAVYSSGANTPTYTNVTMTANEAGDSGGALHLGNSLLVNSIVWDNTAVTPGTAQFNSVTLQAASQKNLIEGGFPALPAAVIATTDPFFGSVPDPGDGDWTTSGDNDYGDLRLLTGSPALDAGDNGSNSESTDLAGAARMQNGQIDLGAYEGRFTTFAHLYPGLSPWADDNQNGLVNFYDYGAGADPSGPPDPLGPLTGVIQLPGGAFTVTATRRTNALDVSAGFYKSAALNAFTLMLEGVDYSVVSMNPSGSDREQWVIQILTDDPRIYVRQEFERVK